MSLHHTVAHYIQMLQVLSRGTPLHQTRSINDIIKKYKEKYPKVDGEKIKRPALTNGLTEVIVNKPEVNFVVRADLITRSRRQSKDAPPPPANEEIINIPLDDIGAM